MAGEAGADPVGEEADADVVDDALGLVMEDGADLEVALEFAEGFFDFEEVFVVALDLRGIGPVDGEVRVEEIPSVVGASAVMVSCLRSHWRMPAWSTR